MTGTELQGQVKRITNDTNNAWSDTQYLEAFNAGIIRVSNIIEKKNDPDLLAQMAVVNGSDIPEYFIRFAGNVPVQQIAGKFVHTATTSITANYFKMPDALTALSSNIPFRNRRNIEALKLAAAISLKSQRGVYDMKNEEANFAELLA